MATLADAVASATSIWTFDESSGNFLDSVGSNDGVDNNTVGRTTGLLGNCIDIVPASSESVTVADDATIDISGSFSFYVWFNPDTLDAGYRNIFYKGLSGTAGVGRNYGIAHSSEGTTGFWLQINGVSGLSENVTSSVAAVASSWNLAVVTYDQTTRTRKLYINGSLGHTESGSSGSPSPGTESLIIGGGGGGFGYHDGKIDECGLFSGYVFDADQVSELWASGTGVAFADWGGGNDAIVGSSAVVFDSTAALTAKGSLAGSAANTFTPSGAITGRTSLAGSSAATFGGSAALTDAANSEFLRPDSDITTTGVSSGTFASIDESVASDSDYVLGGENTEVTYECSLTNPSGTPGSGTTTVRYRAAKFRVGALASGGNTLQLTVSVYQGATLIATDTTRTLDGVWTDYSFTPDMSSVTDWNDLRLRFVSAASGGNATNRRALAVSFAEVEAPAGIAGAIAGSSAVVFDSTATLTGKSSLAGSSAVAFTTAGAITGKGTLAGASSATFDSAAALTAKGSVAGTAAVAFGSSAALTGAGAVAGTSAVAFTPSGTVAGTGAVAGTSAVTFGSSATLSGIGSGAIAGTASASFGSSAALTGKGSLAGTAANTFGSSATVRGVGTLAGTSAALFTLEGVLPAITLSGTSSVVFGSSAVLTGRGALAGSSAVVFGSAATIRDANVAPASGSFLPAFAAGFGWS